MEKNKYSILIVDDDKDLSMLMLDMLSEYGYSVTLVCDCQSAFEMLSRESFHIILLDINLPDGSGYEMCNELRKISTTPIIFASARISENDIIKGYDIGGDDYLPKPYSMQKLLSHVNALVRRVYGYSEKSQYIRFGNITVNTTSRTVLKDEKPVSLSLREFDLLEYLCKHKNIAISKQTLISEVWGAYSYVEPSTLTVHIRWLREKLEENPATPEFIKTVWGLGYMLEVK